MNMTKQKEYFGEQNFKIILLISLLIILPLAAYWLYSNFVVRISPYYEDYDPEFIYFLNSLTALRGGNYTYIDHPGTPLEVIGSGILLATYPFLSHIQGGFTFYHLEHPELFLELAHGFIAVTSIVCALFFYYTAISTKRLENILTSAALSIMFFVIHPLSFVTLQTWSHNSFNFPLSTFLLIVLYRTIRKGGEIPLWKIIGIGLGIGVLTATTIYFAGWIAGAIITLVALYRLQGLSWRKTVFVGLAVAGSSLAGFILSTLPIFNFLSPIRIMGKRLMAP